MEKHRIISSEQTITTVMIKGKCIWNDRKIGVIFFQVSVVCPGKRTPQPVDTISSVHPSEGWAQSHQDTILKHQLLQQLPMLWLHVPPTFSLPHFSATPQWAFQVTLAKYLGAILHFSVKSQIRTIRKWFKLYFPHPSRISLILPPPLPSSPCPNHQHLSSLLLQKPQKPPPTSYSCPLPLAVYSQLQ